MHEHNECKHEELKYCPICDVVWCVKCHKEWKQYVYTYYPYMQPYNYPYITYNLCGPTKDETITILDYELHKQLPPKDTFAYDWKRDYLSSLNPNAGKSWESLVDFRNKLVYGLSEVDSKEIEAEIAALKRLFATANIKIDK